jgi:hypothetical protein
LSSNSLTAQVYSAFAYSPTEPICRFGREGTEGKNRETHVDASLTNVRDVVCG